MKALELTVYPHFEHNEICYANLDGIGDVNVDYWIACKRLTDAELAAEVHSQRETWAAALYDDLYVRYLDDAPSTTSSRERFEMGERAKTLYRFATLPHYDEVTA